MDECFPHKSQLDGVCCCGRRGKQDNLWMAWGIEGLERQAKLNSQRKRKKGGDGEKWREWDSILSSSRSRDVWGVCSVCISVPPEGPVFVCTHWWFWQLGCISKTRPYKLHWFRCSVQVLTVNISAGPLWNSTRTKLTHRNICYLWKTL